MIKAMRYLKPFWLSVLGVIALVFAQVQFDLALPDYMSRIVTYGIQYGGITSPLAEMISSETAAHMKYFMSDAEIREFEQSFTPVSKGDAGYPENASGEVWIQGEVSEEASASIEKAFMIASVLNMNPSGQMDPAQLWPMLEANPAMASSIMEMADKQLEGYTEDNLRALKIMMVKNE